MAGIAQQGCNPIGPPPHAQQEGQGQGRDQRKGSGEHRIGLVVPLVGKPEEGGFHAKGEHHQHQCRVGIQIGDHAIAAL